MNWSPEAASQPTTHAPFAKKADDVLRVAEDLFQQKPDWVVFFRELLGVGGVVRTMFPSADDMAEFEKSAAYHEIQHMMTRLRENAAAEAAAAVSDGREPTKVITVRMPKSLHELLRLEAHERKTSMNKLCITKLLQVLDEGLIPLDMTFGDESTNGQPTADQQETAPQQQEELTT